MQPGGLYDCGERREYGVYDDRRDKCKGVRNWRHSGLGWGADFFVASVLPPVLNCVQTK